MKKKLVLLAMLVCLLALGLTVIGCPTEDDDSSSSSGGGPINFSGEYWEDNHDVAPNDNSCKAVLDLTAKTLTVTKTSTNSKYTPFSLNDVTISETTDVSWSNGQHTGTWAYVKNGSDKIGVVYIWKINIGSYTGASYDLVIGSNSWGGAFKTAAEDVGADPRLDLSDVVTTNQFSGGKEE